VDRERSLVLLQHNPMSQRIHRVRGVSEERGNIQGSEWSAEDWTGLASQVESQV